MQPMTRTALVYKAIPTGGGTAGSILQFDQQPDLNGCLIVGFETFTVAQFANDPDRVAVLSAADSLNTTVTLYEGSDARFEQMPFTSLDAALNSGIYRECDPCAINWQSCYWKFNAAVTAGTSIVMQFHYIRPEDLPTDADRVALFGADWDKI